MGPGQDPHSYEPSTADLTRVAEADVIFINGWDLEEGLVDDLANIAGDTPLVPVSAGIEPLYFGAGGDEVEDEHSADPHVWMDPQNVWRWVRNVSQVLGSLDRGNAGHYADNAAAYEEELVALEGEMEEELAQIAEEKRKLVTNHDALAYFARRFDFQIVGTVIPAASTIAEPSAQEMVALVEKMRAEGVCAVFTESTANARLAETVAAELEDCEEVHVLALYTGALGPAGSGATSYAGMMRVDVEAIVQGLGDGD
jgi:ABC-type Zn uptake system ZnuABC Zn-binding protein ZnuA